MLVLTVIIGIWFGLPFYYAKESDVELVKKFPKL